MVEFGADRDDTDRVTRLRAVIFDLDDTLLDTSDVERRRAAAVGPLIAPAIGDDLEAFWRRYRQFALGRERVDLGLLGYDEFRRKRLAYALAPWVALGEELFGAYLALSNAIADTIAPLPGAIETLRAVRETGMRVAILTNGPSAWQRRKLALTGIGGLVDVIAVSAEIGVAKPAAEAFHIACRQLGTAPAQAAMVGDAEPLDIRGAERAGLGRAIWVGETPLSRVAALLAA